MKNYNKVILYFVLLTSLLNSIKTSAQIVSAGENHSIAICKSGSIMAWGINSTGAVGDSTKIDRLLPTANNKLSNIIAVAAGQDNSTALKEDGTVWRWGNGAGNVGISPKQISGLTGIKAISSAGAHILTLKNDSTVWAWGSNDAGQLGDSTTNNTIIPVKVKGLKNIIAIAGGYRHSLALKNDGTVWGWGYNNYGSVGDGSTYDQHLAVQVSGLTNVKAIAAGFDYSMAIKKDGTVWAWGYNGSGQLGDSTKKYRVLPTKVKVLDSIIFIACGYKCAFAIRINGTVWSWGSNGWGQMGSNGAVELLTPEIISKLNGIKYISSSWTHTIMINKHDSVFTCGGNDYGQLGIGNKSNQNLKVAVRSLCPLLTNIRVKGKNIEIANGDRTPISIDNTDFGLVRVSSSQSNLFKIFNKGEDTLKINKISLYGSDSSNFKIQKLTFPIKIKKGDSLTFSILFNPLTKGIKTINVNIAYNDLVNSLFSYSIKGVGTYSAIAIRGLNHDISNGDMSPGSIDNTSFGRVKKYSEKRNKFTIKNFGTDTLKITKISTTGLDSILFTVGNIDTIKVILPSDSAQFEISFLPVFNGSKTATVNIYSNDLDIPIYQFAIDGICVSPYLEIRGNNLLINNKDMTPDINDHTDFGTLNKSNDLKRFFTIYNLGNDTLYIKNIQSSGINYSRFSVDLSQLNGSLLPSDSTVFGLTLKSDSLGFKSADISINSNDTDQQPYRFKVQGTINQNSKTASSTLGLIVLYPNPADKIIRIEYGSTAVTSIISIYSITGQSIFESKQSYSSDISINTSNFTPGLYMVYLRIDNTLTCKLLQIAR